MKVLGQDQITDLLSLRPPRAWCLGVLPDAPPDAIAWFAPVTLGQAQAIHAAQIITGPKAYTRDGGDAELLAQSVLVNPAQFCLGSALQPDEPADGQLEPVFASAAEVGPIILDLAVMGMSAAFSLRQQLLSATGWVKVPDPPQATDLAAYRASRQHPGRWLAGCLPQDPEAELWVAPYTEGDDAAARLASTVTVDGVEVVNEFAKLARLLLGVVRAGPGGEPLLTAEQVLALPLGGAMALGQVAASLTLGGAFGEVRFQRGDRSLLPAGGGEPAADLVLRGEAGAPADGDAGKPPRAKRGHRGVVQGGAGAGGRA